MLYVCSYFVAQINEPFTLHGGERIVTRMAHFVKETVKFGSCVKIV